MLLQEHNDKELLAQWRDGSRHAFNLLFDRYFNKLFQFTLKKIADRELAEELVMDVMLRLWQHRDNLDAENSLNAYLFRSVLNAITDNLRKKAIQTISVEDAFPVDSVLPNYLNTPGPEEQFHTAELQKIYLETVSQLSPKRKTVFELSRLEGRSHLEISKEMNVSVSTVKQHINASLSSIRSVMKDHTDIAFLFILFFFRS